VIDFCRGFARRYPLYPRLCGPAGDSRRRQQQRQQRWQQRWRRQLRAVKRRRRAPRRRPPIGGCRPQGAALITRPCSTVSLYCTRLESTLPCIGASDVCIPPYICIHVYIYILISNRTNTRFAYVYVRTSHSSMYVCTHVRAKTRAHANERCPLART